MTQMVHMPLFSRLIDDDIDVSFEQIPKRYVSVEEWQQLIAQDLSRLLNTRVANLWKQKHTPYSYGANLVCPITADNEFEIQALESYIDHVISAFEPRLKNPKSRVIKQEYGHIYITIDAVVIYSERKIMLSFPVVVEYE